MKVPVLGVPRFVAPAQTSTMSGNHHAGEPILSGACA
jgi:hypothetical protein